MAAVHALESQARPIRAAEWPDELTDLDNPGLYSWWVDRRGAADLAQGLGHRVKEGLIYAGQTGATKWPSGTTGDATLRSRISRNHLRGNIRGSTLRRTLAAALRSPLALVSTGPGRIDSESERRLTAWIESHLEVAVYAFPNADALIDLEHCVLAKLDPPLNLNGMGPTPVRVELARLRRDLTRARTTHSLRSRHSTGSVRYEPSILSDVARINAFLQRELQRRRVAEVTAVEAAEWLASARILANSESRPGLPLRNLLRAGQIDGAVQRPPQPHGRWFITRNDE
jgi:hypothetical protein